MRNLNLPRFSRLLLAILGLAPTQAAELRIDRIEPTGSAITLHWSGPGGSTAFTVQRRTGWPDGIWINPRSSNPWPLTQSEWTDAAPPDSPGVFYRVAALPAGQRGQVLAATPVRTITKTELGFVFLLGGIPVTPVYDIQAIRINYETVDPLGAVTQASGVLFLPVALQQPLPLASYQHGTLIKKSDAPSTLTGQEFYVGAAFATTGYASVMPDYLGLGDGPGFHPYHHAASEATAGVDMLRAARSVCLTRAVQLNGQVFLCGYSQGGHATAALQRELEEFHSAEFTVTASALMAGAYDLSGVTADDGLSGRKPPNPYYFLYLLASYESVYHLAPDLASLLQPPYTQTLPPLLNGQIGSDLINAAMPTVPNGVLRPDYLAALRDQPGHPFRQALADNDLIRWTPKAPTRLYHCSGDQDVPPANSQVAHAAFAARGVTVPLIDPQPGASHGDCAIPAMTQAKAWFDTLKK